MTWQLDLAHASLKARKSGVNSAGMCASTCRVRCVHTNVLFRVAANSGVRAGSPASFRWSAAHVVGGGSLVRCDQ